MHSEVCGFREIKNAEIWSTLIPRGKNLAASVYKFLLYIQFVKSSLLKLYEMDIDITFAVTWLLSFVVSTSTERDRGSGRSAAALPCLWRGFAPLCRLENVTPQGGKSQFVQV